MATILGYSEIILALFCFLFLWSLRNDNAILRNWPMVGMLPSLITNVKIVHQRCTEVLEQSGGTFLFVGPWFTNMNMLATVDPANVHYIMSSNFSNFPKGPEFRRIFDFLGEGIFNSDHEAWNLQRRMNRALINHQRFNKFVTKTSLEKVEKGLVPVLEHASKQGIVLDMQDLFQRFTFDSTCILVTGYDPGCLSLDFPDVPFSKAMDDAEEVVFMRHVVPPWIWKMQRWLGIGQERKLKKAKDVLDNVVDNFIFKKRKELKVGIINKLKEDEEGVDFLTSLLSEEDEGGVMKLDDKFLRDAVLNLMIAGRDTTSSCLTWFLWLVSTHPIVERKIREEIKASVLENNEDGQLFKADKFKKMVYLHGALCEALRLYPPVPFQHKGPTKPDVLPSGHKVDPKTKVLFSLYAMGRMESIWGKDCLKFKPERWISERGTLVHEPSYKFLAFNAGPRTCLGKEVAFTQMKAVAVAILRDYNVQVVEGHIVAPNVSIILYMKYGLMVRISKRLSRNVG